MLQFQPQEHLLHSYIVVSQSEQARERLALDLTAAMLCRSDGVRPCRACRDCRKVYDHVHPDVIYVEPDRSGKIPVIKVDQIRSVAATAYILPSEAEKKVYVLRQAELMNLNAQNAFLKLLEEPPRSAAFILAAASPDSLLTTVRSRCALLRDPTEQPLESEEMRTLADDYLHAVASQDRMTILRWCLAHEGMEAQTIAAGRYAKIAIRGGDCVTSVQKAWEEIWADEELGAQRAFTVDFEAYLPGEDMSCADIDVYVALR